MNRKFDIRNRERLKAPERLKNMPPEQLVASLSIAPGSTILDVGCGVGFWTIPLARHIGAAGRVYAADISPEMLEALRDEMQEAGITNVEPLLSEESRVPLTDGSMDVVLMSCVYHELDDRATMLAEIHRLLRPGGQFINLDWRKKETPSGPPLEHRLEVATVQSEMTAAGFLEPREVDLYDYYFIVCGKKSR
ncbi:MAG: class I SAM-dependent methyltransferase [Candidatus Tectomicrobia bacterium]|nr:class I SAM-dependent methyltransferase [Candidatus Tectomicrobia bacterium]